MVGVKLKRFIYKMREINDENFRIEIKKCIFLVELFK